jgi:hypothetical protein
MKEAEINFAHISKTWNFQQNEDCQLRSKRSLQPSRGHKKGNEFKANAFLFAEIHYKKRAQILQVVTAK